MPDIKVETSPTAAAAAAVSDPNVPWHAGFENKDVAGWVASFGDAYKTPESMAVKAYNLEKLLGADKAGRAIVPPKADAKPEEITAFYRKHLGAPEKIDGYPIPKERAEDKNFQAFREFAHSIGMPASQYNAMVAWTNEQAAKRDQTFESVQEAQANKEMGEVVVEWGTDYDQKTELGRRAARSLIPHETPDELEEILGTMEGALGTKFTMNLWAAIGAGMGEHAFVQGSGGGGGGGMTPEAARLRINELKGDKEWGKKFMNGDTEARAEWDKLHKVANIVPA